ncbi:hypothetical protein [Microbacterium sp. S1037]|uniref:hypothetical protein n=1 Tax=Microbacterium sp. S1037 TaxID=3398227 RepID=UPI003AAFA930
MERKPGLASRRELLTLSSLGIVGTAAHGIASITPAAAADISATGGASIQEIAGDQVGLADSADTAVIIASAASFPDIDSSGEEDSWRGLQSAINAALAIPNAVHPTVVVPSGRYKVSRALLNAVFDFTTESASAPRSLRILAHGAHITKSGHSFLLDIQGSVGAIYEVASIEDIYDAQPTPGDQPNAMMRVALATPVSNLARGDVVKVIANNHVPGSIPRPEASTTGNYPRAVLMAVVDRIEANDVIITGNTGLFDAVTMSPRLVKLETTFEFRGGILDSASGSTTGMVRCTNLVEPIVSDLIIHRSPASGVQMKGCWSPRVDNIDGRYAPNDPSAKAAGYLVADNGSFYGQYSNLRGAHCRHVWTDDINSTEPISGMGPVAPDALGNFGSTYGASVTAVTGIQCDSQAVSPHHGGRNSTFSNILVLGGAGGIASRGRGHSFRNLHLVGGSVGVVIFTQSDGVTSRTTIDGAYIDGPSRNAIRVRRNTTGSYGGEREAATDHIQNVRVVNSPREALHILNSRLVISNLSVEFPAVVPAVSGASDLNVSIALSNSEVRASAVSLNFSGTAPASIPAGLTLIQLNSDSVWRSSEIDVVFGNPTASPRFSASVSATSRALFSSSFVFDYLPSAILSASSAAFLAEKKSSISWREREYSGVTRRSSAFLVHSPDSDAFSALSVSGELVGAVGFQGHTSALTVPSIPAGTVRGQRLSLLNQSSYPVVVVAGGASKVRSSSAGNPTLNQFESLDLLWTGGVWQQI